MNIATLGGTMDSYNSLYMINNNEPSYDIIVFRLTWEQRVWTIVLYLMITEGLQCIFYTSS
jgi:hypothetical protein